MSGQLPFLYVGKRETEKQRPRHSFWIYVLLFIMLLDGLALR